MGNVTQTLEVAPVDQRAQGRASAEEATAAAESAPRWRSRSAARFAVTGATVLLLIFALSATSIYFRPEGTAWSAWWPASGVAIGVAARFDRRRLWPVAAAIGVVTAAASLINGREVLVAAGAGVAVALEVWVGVTILRTRSDRPAFLNTGADLARLLVCAAAASTTLGLVGGVAVAGIRGIDSYLPAVVASIPAHAVGILLIAPLILPRQRELGAAGPGEAVGIWTALGLVILISFGWNVGLPIAFLATVPITWGATRLAPRSALLLMVVLATAITVLSLSGRGPFAVGVLTADASVLITHLFCLSLAIMSLTLIVFTSQARRLTATVLESATLFKATFDFSPVGSAIVTKTPTGPIVDQLNTAGRDLIGLSIDDPVNIAEHLSAESLATFASVIGDYGKPGATRWRGHLTSEDDRTFDVMIAALPGEFDSNVFTIRFFDITDQLRAQRDQERQYRAQRLESLGLLAGGIAHNLNNVLAPLLLTSQYVAANETNPALRQLLVTMEPTIKRGSDMIAQVLTYSRGEEGQRAKVDARLLIAELETFCRDTVGRSVTVHSDTNLDYPFFIGDSTQIMQVLVNLATNARDAMPNGGKFLIRAYNHDIPLEGQEGRFGTGIAIEAIDSGPGMDAETVARAFEPFYSTKELGKGTGLGLSTSLAIAHGHGGELTILSTPGQGARIQLLLPATDEKATQLAPPIDTTPVKTLRKTVLIVDDEAPLRAIVQATLESHGYTTLGAADGKEAIALIQNGENRFDLVITDMMMPEMGGEELEAYLYEVHPELPVIAASGFSTESDLTQTLRGGTRRFLRKPFSTDELLDAVKKELPTDKV